jgi:hypothetical protein
MKLTEMIFEEENQIGKIKQIFKHDCPDHLGLALREFRKASICHPAESSECRSLQCRQ